ncbi:hypothetical protein EYB45_03355 [Erythrobacteraceae bacterium CFH 75059]|uniref:hypothetical protein n=1 Tax=Qipengyuania thermophila TaxID=2509361 RepID=UPI00101F2CD1|nr:hypothetical protein [Qipengyuania thermophila]TCD06737.1 hypothetical protein EYB45_03355 [Erythrobacteraceae bacterium CFH 75059]
MFEGRKPKRAADAPAENAALLRELRWAELSAQLALIREAQGIGRGRGGDGEGSGRFAAVHSGPVSDARTVPDEARPDCGGSSAALPSRKRSKFKDRRQP